MDRPLDSHRRRSLRLRHLGLGLVTVVVAIVAWRGMVGLFRPSVAAADLNLTTVESGAVEASVNSTGRIIAVDERVLTAPAGSRVVELLAVPGDAVELGQSLLKLDTTETKRRLAAVDERLIGLEIRRRQAELDSRSVRLDLEQSLAIARLEAEEAAVAERRSLELAESGLIAAPDLDAAKLRRQRETIEVKHLESRLDTEAMGLESRIAALANEIRLLEAERQGILAEIVAARIPAPVRGVVTSILDRPGQAVALGNELARVADLSAFAVEASFADSWADELAKGQVATIELAGERQSAVVAAVYPAIESGTVRLRLELDRPDHAALRPQLRVPVSVVIRRGGAGLRIGRGAAIRGPGRQPLFVVVGDRLQRREVEIGLAGLDAWEVRSGLVEGERVVLTDLSHLFHHSELRITGEPR